MKKSILVLLLLALFVARPKALIAEDNVPLNKLFMSTSQMIDYVPKLFDQDPKLISKITWCESHHIAQDHDSGRGFNITGIHDKTFDRWLPLYEKERKETLNKDSTYDQLKMMSWAFSKGDSYRNQWTTYVAYKNGGTYAFHSNLLNKDFVVKCK